MIGAVIGAILGAGVAGGGLNNEGKEFAAFIVGIGLGVIFACAGLGLHYLIQSVL